MNHTTPLSLQPPRSRRGIALVITLLLLVLLSAFAVAFFTRMSVEQASATSYADGVSTRQLAESAVGLVQSQIREATTVPNGAWATQPGMARVYANSVGGTTTTAGKNPYGYYKLYSSNDMTVTGVDNLEAFDPAAEIDQNWAKERALWTDLNEPVRLKLADPADDTQTMEVKRYPIFDPELAGESDMSSATNLSVHNTLKEFKVEGFSIDSKDETTDNQRGRMPVRWIYVLRDGTLTAPASSAKDGLQAVWDDGAGGKVPTKANPVVGRVAFWTDDDTSKVNINTAAGFTTKGIDAAYDPRSDGSFTGYAGSFWDTPRFYTKFDRGGTVDQGAGGFGDFTKAGFGPGGLAISQPPANEFQRFPGHPATTSLGLVFNRSVANNVVDEKTPRLTSQQLYRLLPRITPGGSEGGVDRLLANNNTGGVYNMTDTRLPLKAQRLYASVDEFFFAQQQIGTRRMTTNEFLKGSADTTDPRNQIPAMTEDLIGKPDLDEFQGYRFFLTAHSRAPELNLFGRPRVSIWPVWASGRQVNGVDYSVRRNPIDRLMMFCSTLGPLPPKAGDGTQPAGKLFMFQRWQPYEPFQDANILRNAELLRTVYLASSSAANPGLTEQPIPGFTNQASFATKYNGGDAIGSRDQILTEIFDYIRSGVNITDTYSDYEVNRDRIPYQTLVNQGSPTRSMRADLDSKHYAPRGIVVPAAAKFRGNPKQVAGFGRFPTVSEVSIVFYHAGYVGSKGEWDGVPYFDPSGNNKNDRGVKEHLVRMFVMVETNNPMMGYSRTMGFSDPLDQKDDRNTTPEYLTHTLDTSADPSITLTEGGLKTFSFGGGNLRNEIQFGSGSFFGGSSAAGMEGCLHTFGTRFQEPGSGDDIPPSPPSYNGTDAYTDGSGPYEFQSRNVIHVPVLANGTDQKDCQFEGFDAVLRVKFGTQDLQFIKLKFPPARIPLPSDAYWEDPGGFGWLNTDVTNGNSVFEVNQNSSTKNQEWPWACALLNHPAAMKSLGHRIWWVNGTWRNANPNAGLGHSVRADSNDQPRFDANGSPIPRDGAGYRFSNRWRNILQPGDVVRSLVPAPAENTDLRTIALTRSMNDDPAPFEPLQPGYDDPTLRHVQRLAVPGSPLPGELADNTTPGLQTQLLRSGGGTPFIFSGANNSNLSSMGPNANSTTVTGHAIEPVQIVSTRGVTYRWVRKSYGTVGGSIAFGNLAQLPSGFKVGDYGASAGELPAAQKGSPVTQVLRTGNKPGDFDTGYGNRPDGALCNKPDEGHLVWRTTKTFTPARPAKPEVSEDWNYQYPYFTGEYNDEATDTFFSPTRQIPSAVHFGSLLVGPKTGWQTLCFSPNPSSLKASTATGKADHPGMDVDPKDHLLLDLFQMPVVEPYAISEPFSTAGKVNINCEIMPFSYIRRTTALRAALHSVRVTAVSGDQVKKYKTGPQNPANANVSAYDDNQNYRLLLNRDETVKGIAAIFNDTTRPATERFYKSASQICERFLYPAKGDTRESDGTLGPKWSLSESAIKSFWEKHNLGGDNTREKPYADLYPRLTTKSNTFTVHMRVQKLRPQKGREDSDFLKWTEAEDSVAAEYRGETQIERYLDPQDRRFDKDDTTVPASERFNVDATVYRPLQTNTRPLDFAYRFRTIGSKRFAPAR